MTVKFALTEKDFKCFLFCRTCHSWCDSKAHLLCHSLTGMSLLVLYTDMTLSHVYGSCSAKLRAPTTNVRLFISLQTSVQKVTFLNVIHQQLSCRIKLSVAFFAKYLHHIASSFVRFPWWSIEKNQAFCQKYRSNYGCYVHKYSQ